MRKGTKKPEVDFFLMEALFSALTNVDFDPERIKAYIEKAVELRKILNKESKVDITTPWAEFKPASSMDELIKQAEEREINPEILKEEGEDIASLKLTILYALKGIAAYVYHAEKLEVRNEEIYRGFKELLVNIFKDKTSDLKTWIERALEI